MKDLEFNLKTKLKFGINSALRLGEYLKDFKFKKAGVIVDSAVYNLDYIKQIFKGLKKEGIDLILFEYNFKAEPTYDFLDKAKTEFLEKEKPKVDCFVGIGGGSVIDFAKGLATIVVNEGPAINYRGFPKDINVSLPVIALPTTAGTASEVTYNAVFIDEKEQKKFGINTMNNFPVLAVLDPNLIAGSPKKIIASSGMDALTHALESYVACQSNDLTKIFAKEAFKLIFNNLPKVFENPQDLESIGKLQLGAYLAGISLMNSGSGPAGALSYTLGVHFKVPHGIAGAVFIPHTVEHNVKNGHDYSELYDLIEGIDKNIEKERKNAAFSKQIFELCEKLEIPKSLRSFGVNEKNIRLLFKDVEGYEKAFLQNPTPFNIDDSKKLLLRLLI